MKWLIILSISLVHLSCAKALRTLLHIHYFNPSSQKVKSVSKYPYFAAEETTG